MSLIQTLVLVLPYLFLLLQGALRLPPRIAQTSKALLNLMLSPLKFKHHLPLVLMMPTLKLNPSEDVRYLPVACHPTRSKIMLSHMAISCPLHPLTTSYAPCAALTRPKFCSKL
jgi:hypothetical protein